MPRGTTLLGRRIVPGDPLRCALLPVLLTRPRGGRAFFRRLRGDGPIAAVQVRENSTGGLQPESATAGPRCAGARCGPAVGGSAEVRCGAPGGVRSDCGDGCSRTGRRRSGRRGRCWSRWAPGCWLLAGERLVRTSPNLGALLGGRDGASTTPEGGWHHFCWRAGPRAPDRRAHLSRARGPPILPHTIRDLDHDVRAGEGAEMADQGTGSTRSAGGCAASSPRLGLPSAAVRRRR